MLPKIYKNSQYFHSIRAKRICKLSLFSTCQNYNTQPMSEPARRGRGRGGGRGGHNRDEGHHSEPGSSKPRVAVDAKVIDMFSAFQQGI